MSNESTPVLSVKDDVFCNEEAISVSETVEKDGIRFEDGKKTNKAKTFVNSHKRRLSFRGSAHSSSDQLFTIREKVEPAAVFPGVFKTISHRIENEIESRHKDSSDSPFTGILYHIEDPQQICRSLNSDFHSGLSNSQYKVSLKAHGFNIQSKPPNEFFKKIFMYFFGGFGLLLFGGGILCIVSWKPLGEPDPSVANLILGIILLVIFVLQAAFNFLQDFSSSRVIESIHNMIPSEALILRDSKIQSVDSKNLVPGDIVHFEMGAKIPADIRIFEASSDLAFDRSILTGESNAIPATSHSDKADSNYLESSCIAMQGTFIVSGSGKGIVVATGDSTIFGTIAKLTSLPKKGLSPIQWEILRFVFITCSVILILVILVVILWCVWLRKDHREWISVSNLIVDIVSIAVAFIPEGLPIALTTCLIITASQMRKNKILCKSLSIVETLGSVSVLCFDKTGTLTKNNMVVTNICIGIDETACKYSEDDGNSMNISDPIIQLFLTIASLCNDGVISEKNQIHGNATDKAILKYASEFVTQSYLKDIWVSRFELTFNSKSKYMAKLLQQNSKIQSSNYAWNQVGLVSTYGEDKSFFLAVKGAPDILMPKCKYMMRKGLNGTTEIIEIEDCEREKILNIQSKWSSNGSRVILLAYKIIPLSIIDLNDRFIATQKLHSEISDNMIFVGLLGIEDPPRKNIEKTILQLRGAGIKVVMITGDFEITGVSIAKQTGIVTTDIDYYQNISDRTYHFYESERSTDIERALILTGSDMARLSDEDWSIIVRYKELVFARTTPEQKLLIIKQFQKFKQVIGMTGDGINDSPSLKQADIGISLISASDIAKEAADLILMNDGLSEDALFNSIIEALKFGRLVFENLRKTVGYLLPAGTYAELWPVLLNIIFGTPQILSSFLMIMICCITDCMNAITLAYEVDERNLLSKKPRSITKEKLVDWKLFLHSYFTIGTFYALTSFFLGFLNLQRNGFKFSLFDLSYGTYLDLDNVSDIINMSSSIYFVNLVIMQSFNLLAMRTRYLSLFQHSPTKNKWIFMSIPFGLAATFILNYIPGIQNAMGTAQVPVEYYFISVGFGAVILIYDELRKLCNRKYPKGFLAKIAW